MNDYYESLTAEEDMYTHGYNEGRHGVAFNPAPGWNDEERSLYKQGWDDGAGEYEASHSVRPVEDDYYLVNAAPYGYEWVGEKRVAQDGEFYLTKNGNAKKQVGTRGNNQTRHILRRK